MRGAPLNKGAFCFLCPANFCIFYILKRQELDICEKMCLKDPNLDYITWRKCYISLHNARKQMKKANFVYIIEKKLDILMQKFFICPQRVIFHRGNV